MSQPPVELHVVPVGHPFSRQLATQSSVPLTFAHTFPELQSEAVLHGVSTQFPVVVLHAVPYPQKVLTCCRQSGTQ